VLTDLVEIRRQAEAKESENLRFRRYLTAHHHGIEPFHIIAAEIQRRVDCTACANCCRYSIVTVSRTDVEAIARHLGYDVEHVIAQYTEPDPDAAATRILKSTNQGCVFLDGNLCTIYEARPRACREFPHVALGRRSLGARVPSLWRWSSF
jgi:hypothetical protein